MQGEGWISPAGGAPHRTPGTLLVRVFSFNRVNGSLSFHLCLRLNFGKNPPVCGGGTLSIKKVLLFDLLTLLIGWRVSIIPAVEGAL